MLPSTRSVISGRRSSRQNWRGARPFNHTREGTAPTLFFNTATGGDGACRINRGSIEIYMLNFPVLVNYECRPAGNSPLRNKHAIAFRNLSHEVAQQWK